MALRAQGVSFLIGFGLVTAGHAFAEDSGLPSQYDADGISVPAARADEPVTALSVEKASLHLDQGSVAWSKQKNCVSCHTNGTYLFIRPSLSQTLGTPPGETRTFFVEQLESLNNIGVRKLKRSGTRPAQVIYIAAGLAAWDAHITKVMSPETDKALRLAFELQNEDGSWHSLTCWPPFESSAYQETHMMAMAIASAPSWTDSIRKDEKLLAKVGLLTKYLRESKLPHDYARVLQLWTSLRLDGILDKDQQQTIVTLIRQQQRDDGGWSIRTFATPEQWGGGNRAAKLRAEPDFESPASDGHMTGLALLVLQESGVANDDDQVKNGLKWLRANQRESGRWWTRSLNTDKWHFITYSATAYSLLAIQNAASGP